MRLIGIKIISAEPVVRKSLRTNAWYPFGHDVAEPNMDDIQAIGHLLDEIEGIYQIDERLPKVSVQCIVGMNGSGKTSLLDILFRIINNFALVALKSDEENMGRDLQFAYGLTAKFYFETNGTIGCIYNGRKPKEMYIKAWATEGHAVAVPGLGSMRFGIRSTSVANVNKVGADLITARRVIFTPSVEIKDELKKTSINITCYDRNGEIVKRVTSTDDSEVEDPDNEPTDPNGGPSTGSGTGTGSGTDSGNTNRQYSLNVSLADTSKGTVDTSVNKSYSEGSRVNIQATPASGYVFEKWSDGNTSASRTVVMNANTTLVASFIASTGSGTGQQGGGDNTGEDEDRPDYI